MGQQNMRTPPWLVRELERKLWPFRIDLFASKENHVKQTYFTEEDDAFTKTWPNRGFGNPPFLKSYLVVQRADIMLKTRGVNTCLVLPIGCSQDWFHAYVLGKQTILYPDQRIQFVNPDGTMYDGADRDTMIVVFNGLPSFSTLHVREPQSEFVAEMRKLGQVVKSPGRKK